MNSPSIDNMQLPQQSSTYVGRLTDTSRWDKFRSRAGDLIVCTPSKCGTTWMQAICANLILGTSDFEGKITDISPWFDSNLKSLEKCLDDLEAQSHRRFIKTHTPLDGIPYFDSSQYLIVYRDPKDVYFSFRNHLLNMFGLPEMPLLADDPRQGFRAWMDIPFEAGLGEQSSLEAFAQHFLSFWIYRHLDNFHLFHYGDMNRDIGSTIQYLADLLDIGLTESRKDEICEAVSFTKMKSRASAFVPGGGQSVFKVEEAFFSSGQNDQWRGVLESDDLDLYNDRISGLLPPDAVEWLEHGNPL